ncbi:phosphotransferase family protein [Glacieibacterium frigidum]|uniref:Phosphotransferase family protein n=1 Tax=Glacieibacterium frigidum TaxID=2593303 RepID=A0A552UAQ8_9SPHN|nr:phosphotransferase family protein [Glacieibacterium frigidum]
MTTTLSTLAPRLDPQARGVQNVRRLSGGATQEIWRFDLDTGTPLILRRAPGGLRIAETVGLEVEARLLAAAGAGGVPVPGVRLVLGEGDGLGQGFVMDFVEGETLGGRIVRAPPAGLARQCGAILARIHALDPGDFPTLARRSTVELVDQWRAVYRAAAWPRPVFEVALRWLDSHRPPPPARPALVHGDFRNGNLMIGAEGVRAVLDWELAHVGDPLEDLGWLCVNSWRFGRSDLPVGGFGTVDDLVAGYGGAVDRAALHWWEVFGTLRWGCMCAGMAAAFRGPDPSVERAMIARRTSETEIDLLRLLGV